MKKRVNDDGKCIFTVFRKIDDCECNEGCEYFINCKESHNCALEYANEGKHTLEQIAKVMDYTSTGIMIIQNNAINKLKKRLPKNFKINMYD